MSGKTSAAAQDGKDLSVLRAPISLGSSDVLQILQCIKSGTEEVQNVLLQECAVILECRVCKSMFRGIPNYLAHKRVYCTKKHCENAMVLGNVDTELGTAFVDPECPDREPRGSDAVPQRPVEFYTDVQSRLSSRRDKKRDVVIKLQRIDGSANAMEQEMAGFDTSQDMSNSPVTSDDEICVDSSDDNSIIKPPQTSSNAKSSNIKPNTKLDKTNPTVKPKLNGKSSPPSTKPFVSSRELLSKVHFCDTKTMTCRKCGINYSSFKSLRRHMFKKHPEVISSFSCPRCDCLFSKFWNLIRHMLTIHGMSKKEVESYRERNNQIRMKLAATLQTKMNSDAAKCVQPNLFPNKKPTSQQNSVQAAGKDKAATEPKLKELSESTDKISPKQSSTSQTKLSTLLNGNKKQPAMVKCMSLSSSDLTKMNPMVCSQQGFTLLTCETCGKAFGKKETLDKHSKLCDSEISFKISPVPAKKNTPRLNGSKDLSDKDFDSEEDGMDIDTSDLQQDMSKVTNALTPASSDKCSSSTSQVKAEPRSASLSKGSDRGSSSSPQSKILERSASISSSSNSSPRSDPTSFPRLNQKELGEIQKIVSVREHKCQKCGSRFRDMNALYHHAARHIGWNLYQCKVCNYKAYNGCDCKNHIRRAHAEKIASSKDLNDLFTCTSTDDSQRGFPSSGSRSNLRNVIRSPKKFTV